MIFSKSLIDDQGITAMERVLPLLAKYNGKTYNYVKVRGKSYLMTYDSKKADDSFYAQRNYYLKDITISMDDVEELYALHFWVTYKDIVEGLNDWLVDEGQPLHQVPDIIKEEVGLAVMHDKKGDSWIQHDKNAASKIVKLDECEKLRIEKHIIYYQGSDVDEKSNTEVSREEFKNTIIMCRRENN